ncbi:tetratricopeptide repeat protein [Salinispira pacifica]|uniref:TPR domain protein n=1 Tax=Salinispira pacifica TaxID=1307761 RepID=V5WHZ0_9SPIO|nr:tetratricopeptide repeat protein [Salinispira pacifica]AHC14786.1 TPR domain protein [Salinispira pacifica]
MQKGIHLYKEGKFQEALRFFRSIDVEEDQYSQVSYYLGLCYTRLEQYDEALIYLDQVIASSDDFAQAYQSRMVIGYIYAETGRYRLAEFEFQHLLDEGYESARVHAALGYILYEQGNIPGSIKNLEEALNIDPENPTALNSLAFIMADQGLRLSVARDYIRRALNIRPDSAAYMDTLGWVLFKSGELEGAMKALKKARDLAPDEKEIQEHFAHVKKAGMINS